MLVRTQGTCICWKKTWDGNVHEILIISSSAIEVTTPIGVSSSAI
jgi:hypothetical protein